MTVAAFPAHIPDPSEGLMLVSIGINAVVIGHRLRSLKDHRVEALAKDIDFNGLIQPIVVVEVPESKNYQLVDGMHRLAALRSLGRIDIDAIVIPGDRHPEVVRYSEIMANINRERLTKLERAEYLAELDRVFKAMRAGAKHGGDRRSERVARLREQNIPILGLKEETADRVGLSYTSFRRAIGIANDLAPSVISRIRETWIADHQNTLFGISQLADHAMQTKVCDILLADPPRATTVADAILLAQGRALPRPDDVLYYRATATWSRLPAKAKGAFLDQHKREVLAHAKAQGWTFE